MHTRRLWQLLEKFINNSLPERLLNKKTFHSNSLIGINLLGKHVFFMACNPRYKYLSCLMPFRKHHILFLLVLLFSVSVKAQSVYKTPSGKKYHLASCHTVKNVSEEITVAKAKELGLEPCKVCKPETMYGAAPSTNKAQGQSETVQCKGLTKAGTRCKHMTRIANGYCFQHQPE